MNFAKIGEWFVTDAGKRFSFYLAGTTTAAVVFANFLPQTLLLNQYKELVQHYNNGMSVPLTTALQARFQKALNLIEVAPTEQDLFRPFFNNGFDIMSAGSSYSKYGVIVGLPVNFSYDNIDTIDRSKIKVNENSIDWNSEDGQKLLNSLIMSESAQLYAIAREIKFRQTIKPIMDIFNASTSCLLVYSLSNYTNTKLNLYAKPRSIRYVFYSFVGLFAFGIYAMIKDMSQVYFEEKIDGELKKNKILAEGGKEFYSKLLERNTSIRSLMGKDGEKLYTVLGNENHLFRTKNLPIVQRKSFFDQPLAT